MPTTRLTIATASSFLALLFVDVCAAAEQAPPDFAKHIAPIFAKYCAGCHNAMDVEGDLSLESFADLQKGGSRGAAIVPGRADASLLVRALTGEVEPAMPPEDSPRPTEAEIALLRAWIDAGAKGPDGAESQYPDLTTPEIAHADNVRDYVTSLAVSPDGKRLAIGQYRHVDLVDPATKKVVATISDLPGKVNGISYSADGTMLVAASGVAGLYGVAAICRAEDAAIVTQIKGHRDALYDARLSPDGKLLATCGYDRQICIWDVASGELLRTLSGHNGAVYELAFSADGTTLATASADDTVKIWNVATGERFDTLGQPEGEQCAVEFSPDSNWIVAGGADRQLRMWQFVSREQAQINPLKFSRTAHDSSIVKLAFSPDGSKLVTASEGRELMLWDTNRLTPVHPYEQQSDVITGLEFDPAGDAFYVARMDGTWQRYDVTTDDDKTLAADRDANDSAAKESPDKPPRFDGAEQEPNNAPAAANAISTDALVRGVIGKASDSGEPDVDVYRFHARGGEKVVLEIKAARNKSPLDSKLEVLDAGGKPIPRVVLQAVRETYFTFRGHNSTDHNDFRMHSAADMELNEYLYSNGEVMRLWMLPRGPDSGFLVYPGTGNRHTFFGTTAVSHALNAPAYIVEPHSPGDRLIPNGLPEYTLYYENDDDGWRKLGADSRLVFTAPADGDYLVRVSDVREFGGDDYKYELVARAPHPDFKIKVGAPDLTINAGSGKEFSITAQRMDEYDGEIRLDVSGLPPGFHVSSPLVIQAGQNTAFAALNADANAPAPTAENAKLAKITATAVVNGKEITKEGVPLGEIKLGEKPKLLVEILPSPDSPQLKNHPGEFVIAPGETISAIVRVERNGFDGVIVFGQEDSGRNLPHGVYVDNIGLNGMTLLQGETERKFFITARKWVSETSRPFHLRAKAEGNQTSWPVIMHVRQNGLEE